MLKSGLAEMLERDGKTEESLKLLNELKMKYPGTKFAEFVQSSIDMASKQEVK
jgi:3,4-dihydroxy-2-butanone 4-phosphate synthase